MDIEDISGRMVQTVQCQPSQIGMACHIYDVADLLNIVMLSDNMGLVRINELLDTTHTGPTLLL